MIIQITSLKIWWLLLHCQCMNLVAAHYATLFHLGWLSRRRVKTYHIEQGVHITLTSSFPWNQRHIERSYS